MLFVVGGRAVSVGTGKGGGRAVSVGMGKGGAEG